MWYAGSDWADHHHDEVVIDEQGQQIAKWCVMHSAEGLAELIAFLQAIGDVAHYPDHLPCIRSIPQRWRRGATRREPRPMPLPRSCWPAKGVATWTSCGAGNPVGAGT